MYSIIPKPPRHSLAHERCPGELTQPSTGSQIKPAAEVNQISPSVWSCWRELGTGLGILIPLEQQALAPETIPVTNSAGSLNPDGVTALRGLCLMIFVWGACPFPGR